MSVGLDGLNCQVKGRDWRRRRRWTEDVPKSQAAKPGEERIKELRLLAGWVKNKKATREDEQTRRIRAEESAAVCGMNVLPAYFNSIKTDKLAYNSCAAAVAFAAAVNPFV